MKEPPDIHQIIAQLTPADVSAILHALATNIESLKVFVAGKLGSWGAHLV